MLEILSEVSAHTPFNTPPTDSVSEGQVVASTVVSTVVNPPSPPSPPPADSDTSRSLRYDTEITVQFRNQLPSGHNLKVKWVDYNGVEQQYADLESQQSYTQKTYKSHPWRLYDVVMDRCVLTFVGREEDDQTEYEVVVG